MKLTAVQKFTLLDYPGKIACIAFTPGCNMRCGFCHNSEFVLPEKIEKIKDSFISEDAFFHFLESRRELLEGVVVSGGEPSIWNDLPQFLERIKEMGFLVKLDTNGNNPVMLESLLKKGTLDYVAMDIKSSLKEYASLVGAKVQEERLLKSIALLKESGIDYEFRTTLIKEHHTPQILEELKELFTGSKRLYLQTFRPEQTLDPIFESYHPFSADEMDGIADFFRESVSRVSIRK